MSTLAEFATNDDSRIVIDTLTEDSPLLRDAVFTPSSNGLYHISEEVSRIVGGNIIDPDGVRPSMLAESVLRQHNLSVLGGIMKKGRETVDILGGPAKYFGKKTPPILRNTGMDVESSLIYNSLFPYANNQKKLISCGGTGSDLYSLLIVTWTEEEMSLLNDSRFSDGGEFLEIMPLNGGDPYEDPAKPGAVVYGQDARAFIGSCFANPRYIGGIRNISIAKSSGAFTDKMVTMTQISDMLDEAHAVPGRTRIYCHPKLQGAIGELAKGASIVTTSGERDISYRLDSIDGILFSPTRNMAKGETAVSVKA